MNTDYKHSELMEKIIKAAYEVYNELGYGFLEKVYENALAQELKSAQLNVTPQAPIKVYYKQNLIGDYYADLLVDYKVIIEIKAVNQLAKIHEVQLVNYLKATKYEIGLLINFGDKIEIKRKIFDR